MKVIFGCIWGDNCRMWILLFLDFLCCTWNMILFKAHCCFLYMLEYIIIIHMNPDVNLMVLFNLFVSLVSLPVLWFVYIRMSLLRFCCRKDFVLYIGGCVWPLDWCPKLHQGFNCHINCEEFIFRLSSLSLIIPVFKREPFGAPFFYTSCVLWCVVLFCYIGFCNLHVHHCVLIFFSLIGK